MQLQRLPSIMNAAAHLMVVSYSPITAIIRKNFRRLHVPWRIVLKLWLVYKNLPASTLNLFLRVYRAAIRQLVSAAPIRSAASDEGNYKVHTLDLFDTATVALWCRWTYNLESTSFWQSWPAMSLHRFVRDSWQHCSKERTFHETICFRTGLVSEERAL